MGRVLTNNTGLQYAIESSTPGVLPGSPVWKLLEPNSLGRFGADITTVAREPISDRRQRRKGTTVDLDSALEYENDLTLEQITDFSEAFLFAVAQGALCFRKQEDSALVATGTGLTVTANGDLAQNTLMYLRGWANASNNGLKVVGAASTTTAIVISGGLTAETPAALANVSAEVAGIRGATGDIEINAQGNLISTSLDFTTLPLVPGQFIHVGGLTSTNQFDTAANLGLAQVETIAANLITLKKKLTTFALDAGAGKQIDLLYGQYITNVAVSDANYLERTIQVEAAFPNLGSGGETEYEYSIGNYANEMTFNMPLTDKATMSIGLIGQDTEEPTQTRKTNAANGFLPQRTGAFNTSADFLRLRIAQTDETGITTDFKSATLTVSNNVSPEKVLGFLGSKFINTGNFAVSLEAQVVFTSSAVVSAIRNNETLSMDFALKNDDGGFVVDIPSCTMGGGNKNFPVNESVLVDLNVEAFEDAILGNSMSVSMFPVLP